MILTERDIKQPVNECVLRVLEARGALDDRMKGLAWLIIRRLASGEKKFVITRNELKKYYPYQHMPASLNVSVENLSFQYTGKKGAYSIETHTVKIDEHYIYFLRDRRYANRTKHELFDVLMHELTHFANTCEAQEDVDKMPRPMKMSSDGPSRAAKRILYLFDKGEMNARATEFKWEIHGSYKIGKLSSYENITHLSSMRSLIEDVKNDVQPSDGQPLSVVEVLLQSRGHRKMQIHGDERYLNPSESDFEKAKMAIVKKLTRAYNEFYQKLSKIYYDEINKNN